ncbi:MAG: GFA family protein [Phenylobacterium sp.]|uniref:GFA family protein n=1 Tax=Phenylobacterium sp. TaxID=1871053 RepID=UPI001B5AB008|nr:GFA family protein [Phenylobacterium sp.]MBP7649850.1 GFA family protein [Phenylobacterium sp.]MBP7817225.1 GFA family protein [Phenylobacterium sp.]MBP9232767.1 GFA family protein [Phenylobacterium sp.]MBP9756441.1 GFA family protein [Phenylobacterium sp.]
MIKASCHCGAVTYEVDTAPTQVTDCNCSLCHRLGVLWAYYQQPQVRVTGATVAYLQGDRTLTSHHCPTCGCTTHWASVDPAYGRMAVNARLMAPELLEGLPVKRLDGAHDFKVLGVYAFGTLPTG